MMRLPSLFVRILPLLLLPLACSNEPSSTVSAPMILTDTLGLKFKLYCAGALCVLDPEDPNIKPYSCDSGYGVDRFAVVWGKILTVHVIRVPESGGLIQLNAAEAGHPVACATDADCITEIGWSGGVSASYACQYGLCQQTQLCTGGSCDDPPLTTNDVLTLCQADLPWPTSCPYVTSPAYASRILQVAATCGAATNCSVVPAECRQVGPVGNFYDGGAHDGAAEDGAAYGAGAYDSGS